MTYDDDKILWYEKPLGPLTIPIFLCKNLRDDEGGLLDGCYKGGEIFINEVLDDFNRATTVVHEALHCISEMYGLDLEEGHVRTLEMALCQMFTELLPRGGAYLPPDPT